MDTRAVGRSNAFNARLDSAVLSVGAVLTLLLMRLWWNSDAGNQNKILGSRFRPLGSFLVRQRTRWPSSKKTPFCTRVVSKSYLRNYRKAKKLRYRSTSRRILIHSWSTMKLRKKEGDGEWIYFIAHNSSITWCLICLMPFGRRIPVVGEGLLRMENFYRINMGEGVFWCPSRLKR